MVGLAKGQQCFNEGVGSAAGRPRLVADFLAPEFSSQIREQYRRFPCTTRIELEKAGFALKWFIEPLYAALCQLRAQHTSLGGEGIAHGADHRIRAVL
jgi:hypothetical protein